ncbi:hypothetical protein JAK74_11415 [Stenotrophomonas maltophilia]|nr:hypothetical protein [Stenotrophomonas maltophilia]
MTISANDRRKNYQGNGVATEFTGPRCFSPQHIAVYLGTAEGTAELPPSQYTVRGAGGSGSTTIVLNTPPAAGTDVLILRTVPFDQPTDITNQGAFLPELHEDSFDYRAMQVQQLDDRQELTIRFPETYPGTLPDLTLPEPEPGKGIGWNADGTGIRYITLEGAGDLTLRDDLADPTAGGALVAYRRPEAASVPRVTVGKLNEVPASVADFGATFASPDNLSQINAAIGQLPRGATLTLPQGRYNVSAPPTNSKGVRIKGPGQLVAPVPVSQINTYRYDHPVAINKEYLWRVFQVLNNTSREIRCYTYGDSTVEGGLNFIDWNYFLQVLLPDMASARGCRNYFKVTNRGIGGSSLAAWNPTPDIGSNSTAAADLVILKCGINDAFPEATRLDVFEQRLRQGLAAIRATSGGDVGSCAILLVGPNAVWDMEYDARNTRWFEQLRSIFEAAARDYKCAYFDAYAYLQDASFAPGRWLDQSPAGTGLHPTNIGHSWIWGGVMDFVFGDSELLRYKTNQFHNRGQFRGYPAAKNPPIWYPNTYAPGITMETAFIVDGFPIDGALTTEVHADGFVMQTLHVTDSGGTVMTRTANANDNVWGAWHGESYRFATNSAYLNNWSDFGGSYGGGRAIVSSQGYVALDGMIKPGTTTAGTSMFGLPAHMRPGNQRVLHAVSEAGICLLEVLPSGFVQLRSGTVAQWLSLSGVGFRR